MGIISMEPNKKMNVGSSEETGAGDTAMLFFFIQTTNSVSQTVLTLPEKIMCSFVNIHFNVCLVCY